MEEEYYVYAYLDIKSILNIKYGDILFEYSPIYIGKGKNKRMYDHMKDRKRIKTMFYNKLNKMIKNNEYPLIIKLKSFYNESDALDFEKLLIGEIKNIKNGGLLYNTTDGGIGCSGYKFTEEVKNKMRSNAIKNKIHLNFPNVSGENHPMYGKKHKKESIEKMSKSRIGTKQTPEWIEKRISKLRGIPLSEETKEKLRLINIGKTLSEETKNKISESKIGSTPWNYNIIKDIILQINMNNEIIKEWYSLIDLEKNGYQKSNIINVCAGKRKTHCGYIWCYKSNYFE